ncbi:hypothetical protein BJ165DRAFT_638416 [Panaeolus papilionaceus]|nr:hypothetical protein BJ165DRAFT_638416 [Panaeolus papilionaceus]
MHETIQLKHLNRQRSRVEYPHFLLQPTPTPRRPLVLIRHPPSPPHLLRLAIPQPHLHSAVDHQHRRLVPPLHHRRSVHLQRLGVQLQLLGNLLSVNLLLASPPLLGHQHLRSANHRQLQHLDSLLNLQRLLLDNHLRQLLLSSGSPQRVQAVILSLDSRHLVNLLEQQPHRLSVSRLERQPHRSLGSPHSLVQRRQPLDNLLQQPRPLASHQLLDRRRKVAHPL